MVLGDPGVGGDSFAVQYLTVSDVSSAAAGSSPKHPRRLYFG